MRSVGKVRGLLYAALACYLIIQPVPAHALLVSAGETVRIDFDLSGELIASPPYQSLQINLEFGAYDLFDPGEEFHFDIFDTEGGASIGTDTIINTEIVALSLVSLAPVTLSPPTDDGIGFYLLGVDLGSFELTSATVKGFDFEGGMSNAVNAPISPVPLPAALPLFLSALAGLGLMGWRRRAAKAGLGLMGWRRRQADA